jgi:hypothetical protein
MKLPRTLLAVAALCVVAAITSSCGSSPSSNLTSHQPPPPQIPPTGTNYTTCGNQQVPNWQSQLFISNYQPAIQAFIQHVSTAPYASQVGYIRIGLGRGGEINLPQGWNDSSSGACYGGYTTNWKYTVGSDANSNWNAYLQSMVEYEAGLGSSKPLLVSITPVNGAQNQVADFIAGVAVQNGVSFGNQGLEASDITNFNSGQACGGDWCNLFAQYPASSGSPIRELQTLGQSCPEGAACVNSMASDTGPIDPLLPFAIAHGANDLELYYQDWLVGFDSSYASSVGATAAAVLYQKAIQAAAATSGVSVQVLFPPQSSDSDFAAVQGLMSNPAVTGTVISIEWSDIEPSNGTFDWTIVDNAISPWTAGDKKVNLVFENTTYGGSACPASGTGSNGNVGSNCAMPSWMWTVLQ